jgi:hypothetical protein
MFLAEVIIPKMFTAYAEDIEYLQNGLHKIQYFCEECDQAFAAAWGRAPGIGFYERGTRFHCPFCGTLHEENVVEVKRNTRVPHKVRLSLKEHKDTVIFEVQCEIVMFKDLFSLSGGKYRETFRFDLAKRRVIFARYDNLGELIDSQLLGNPFELDLFKDSILSSFLPNSLANAKQKAELNSILKLLRETVHAKLEKQLGHKIPSMFVTSGRLHGTFLLPIFNLAFRVAFPNATNLPLYYRGGHADQADFRALMMIKDTEYMGRVMELTSQKVDHITALIRVKGLPDKPAIRRALGENMFDADRLSTAFKLCTNYDYAMRLYAGFKLVLVGSYERGYKTNENLFQFLRAMLPIYGEAGIVQLMETESHLWDCVLLHNAELNEENRQAIKTEGVKLKDLHDWMAKRHRLQNHKNLKLDIPEHIVKRLSMQTDRLKFFLPKESVELLEAGAELHNCVASYSSAVKDHKKWIVLVADEKGRLAACLEIKDKELVQAKIDRNKAVSTDAKLNAEVIAWAKEAGVTITTKDVKEQVEMQPLVAVG